MGIRKPKQYQIESFESFESFLFDWLYRSDVEKLDYVFRSQYTFLCDVNEMVIVDYVDRVENMEADVLAIEEGVGEKLVIGSENMTSLGRPYQEYYLNDDMVNVVAEIYSNDISIFGYEYG